MSQLVIQIFLGEAGGTSFGRGDPGATEEQTHGAAFLTPVLAALPQAAPRTFVQGVDSGDAWHTTQQGKKVLEEEAGLQGLDRVSKGPDTVQGDPLTKLSPGTEALSPWPVPPGPTGLPSTVRAVARGPGVPINHQVSCLSGALGSLCLGELTGSTVQGEPPNSRAKGYFPGAQSPVPAGRGSCWKERLCSRS